MTPETPGCDTLFKSLLIMPQNSKRVSHSVRPFPPKSLSPDYHMLIWAVRRTLLSSWRASTASHHSLLCFRVPEGPPPGPEKQEYARLLWTLGRLKDAIGAFVASYGRTFLLHVGPFFFFCLLPTSTQFVTFCSSSTNHKSNNACSCGRGKEKVRNTLRSSLRQIEHPFPPFLCA